MSKCTLQTICRWNWTEVFWPKWPRHIHKHPYNIYQKCGISQSRKSIDKFIEFEKDSMDFICSALLLSVHRSLGCKRYEKFKYYVWLSEGCRLNQAKIWESHVNMEWKKRAVTAAAWDVAHTNTIAQWMQWEKRCFFSYTHWSNRNTDIITANTNEIQRAKDEQKTEWNKKKNNRKNCFF